jgi:hypothetical protein
MLLAAALPKHRRNYTHLSKVDGPCAPPPGIDPTGTGIAKELLKGSRLNRWERNVRSLNAPSAGCRSAQASDSPRNEAGTGSRVLFPFSPPGHVPGMQPNLFSQNSVSLPSGCSVAYLLLTLLIRTLSGFDVTQLLLASRSASSKRRAAVETRPSDSNSSARARITNPPHRPAPVHRRHPPHPSSTSLSPLRPAQLCFPPVDSGRFALTSHPSSQRLHTTDAAPRLPGLPPLR